MNFLEAIADVFKFFSDKSVGLRKKIFSFSILVIGLVVINGILGLSTFSFTNKKVETVKNIHELLKDESLDTNIRKIFQRDLLAISKKKSLLDNINSLFATTENSSRKINKSIKADPTKSSVYSEPNIYWSILSATGIFIIGGLLSSFRRDNWQYFSQGFWGVTKFMLFNIIGNLFLWYIVFLMINAMPVIAITSNEESNRYISNLIYQVGVIGFLGILIVYILIKSNHKKV